MHPPTPRTASPRLQTALVALLTSATLALMPMGAAHATDREVFDQGHVDAFNVRVDDGAFVLDLKEDITGSHVHRAPETVELHVKSDALTSIPEGVPGAPEAYYLPLTQDHNLLWPGWDTLETQEPGVDPHVNIHFDSVEGPGDIHLFNMTAFGGLTPLLADGETKLNSGDVREQTFPAHTHADWIFTDPGIYTITAHASGTINGTKVESAKATYRITVGEEYRGGGADAGPAPEKPAPEKPAPEKPGPEQSAPEQSAPEKPAPKEPSADAHKTDHATGDAFDQQSSSTSPQVNESMPSASPSARPRDESAQEEGAKAKKPSKTEKSETGRGGSNVGKGDKEKGQPSKKTQRATNRPTSNEGEKPVCTATEHVRPATKSEIRDGAATVGKAQVSGSYTIPANTHTHPNWVFSKPGTYKVTVRQSATLKSGEKVSDTATLTFAVGPGATGATDGHFDFGPRIEGNKLVASVKDDRSSPASWVDPSSVTFALGDAAKAKVPSGIDFVASAGSDVWMIPASQISGVPWLGANSMHPSVIANTTGEVELALLSADGPGNVGVFTSGNFGQIVGAKWFSSTAGSTRKASYAKDRESAKPGQVFKEGADLKVVEIVGKDANGDDCELSPEARAQAGDTGGSSDVASSDGGGDGALARTGAEIAGVTGLALALLAVGFVAIRVRRSGSGR